MNSSLLYLGAIIIVPIIIMMVLRINAALVFLSLCLGDVLVQFVAGDTGLFMSLFSSAHLQSLTTTSSSTIHLAILLLPPLLTMFFMIRTVRKGFGLLFNVLPAAGFGLLLSLLVVPLLNKTTALEITSSSYWTQIQRGQDLIVSASALLCLFFVWSQRPKHGRHNEEKSDKRR